MSESHISLEEKIKKLGIPLGNIIFYFREKCKNCGHQRIAHNELGKCEGVMNKPCGSGCDMFIPE